jgi:hypothetical protein
MEMLLEPPMSPDVSAEQRVSDALVKLIRKLRWMGMDDEAERQMTLALCHLRPADSVIAGPSDTD